MKKKYKVIFNDDEKNYELFESKEDAEKFAKNYCNTKIVKLEKPKKAKQMML